MKIKKSELRQLIRESIINSLLKEETVRPLSYSVGFLSRLSKEGKPIKQVFLNIVGLDNTDKLTLVNNFSAKEKKGKTNEIFYSAMADNPSAFLEGRQFNAMYEYLMGTGKYIMPNKDILKAEIEQAKYDSVTRGEINEQNTKFEDLFEKIMKNLSSPETQALLEKIGKIGFDINEKIYGHVRSAGNALRAYSTKPDSTFIATRKTWRSFNRILKANPTKIILSVPMTAGKDNNKAETELGVRLHDITDNPHKMDAFKVQSTTGLNGFYTYVYFDVSDTVVIPGQEDLWNGKAGLVDNLKGVLNSLATDEVDKQKVALGDLVNKDTDKNTVFNKKLLKLFKGNTDFISTGDLMGLEKMDLSQDSTVTAMLKKYFEVMFEREHNPDLKSAKIYAAIAATLTAEGVAESEKLRIIKIHERNIKDILTTRKDFVSISIPVTKICNEMKQLKESTEILENEDLMEAVTVSPEDIMGIFNIKPEELKEDVEEETEPLTEEDDVNDEEDKKEAEINSIKEQFYKTLNNINNAEILKS